MSEEERNLLIQACDRMAHEWGGVPEEPKIVYDQMRPPQVIYPAPRALKSGERVAVLLEDMRAMWQLAQGEQVTTSHIGFITHRLWQCAEWIHVTPADYDPKTNTLTLHGYHRLYQFDVWVSDESEQKGDTNG